MMAMDVIYVHIERKIQNINLWWYQRFLLLPVYIDDSPDKQDFTSFSYDNSNSTYLV